MLYAHHAIEPLMLQSHNTDGLRCISIKANSDNLTQTLVGLEKLIRDYSDYPFDYQFLDDQFDQTYREDDVLVKL